MLKNRFNSVLLLLTVCFPLLLLAGGLFFIMRNSGFSLDKIRLRIDSKENWAIEPLTEQARELLTTKVFPQKYYYLGAGNQCYAFISEDRKYVLKFLKMQHLSPRNWFSPLSFRQKNNQLFSERIFASYIDAFQELRAETGLIYVHFNKSREFQSKVTLIDNKGKTHLLDLDSVEFIVQQRAQKIFERFDQLIEAEDYDGLRMAICSFLKLIVTRCEKGFVDRETSIRNNFGFVDDVAIQFDCTTLTRDSSMKYPLNLCEEVMETAKRLDLWAFENEPDVTFLIQEEAQRIVNSYSGTFDPQSE